MNTIENKRFIVGSDTSTSYSTDDMLCANESDADLCDWLRTARPGDLFPDGEGCKCITEMPA